MSHPLHLFQAFGVELEYMIVGAETLSVLPVTDRVLHAVAGEYLSEVEQGDVSWSNELALHVIELKTGGPAAALAPLPELFQEHVRQVNALLVPLGGRLMPTAMHPWMDPDREMRLWPHDYNAVYEAYHKIFDCRGHGWANLQSVHLNLPFADDAEFGRLHAAIRLLLPIMPALAASSPVVERRLTGLLDNRLDVYRTNARRVPSVSGQVVPEPVYGRAAYERTILQRIYDDLAPHDPQGILRQEWANARGAIARFDRNTIEIRVLDVQECPQADLAICAAITAALQALTEERWTGLARQQAFDTGRLHDLLVATIRDGEQTEIADREYLEQFGLIEPCTARDLWRRLIEFECLTTTEARAAWGEPLGIILEYGPLARRIARSLGPAPSPETLRAVYGELCDCLAAGRMFLTKPTGRGPWASQPVGVRPARR